MIQPHCFTKDWIHAQRETLGAADPEILERAIYAITLLVALTKTDLDFVFKGGTSLLLHLPTPQRLSIDIDITCDTDRESLEEVLASILPDTPFTRFEEQLRGEHRLPKRLHYKFYYPSPIRNGQELPVLLDVVTEPNKIQDIVQKPIELPFIDCVETTNVSTPSVNALLGDKLTAFGPSSIGVPLTEKFSLQVIKQLFDVAQLYSEVTDLSIVAHANKISYEAERSYRTEGICSYSEYLDDVINTCYDICSIDLRGFKETDSTKLLRRGINQLPNHLISSKFKLPQAKIAAAKAAALAIKLKHHPQSGGLPTFDTSKVAQLKNHLIIDQFSILQRLKSISPEAYFYWASLS
ncbi:nucleotidyl transferase AbiEii/AbiGii toxin family protein [Pelagicoccus sp. SDUM812002]|uniref:nucleotidyl transferase AbiEii/AbiGii toxin family protein n=1 Tax=Pelagicoccus sp. SDUM812002 TaxID=3041266 RepID=UPI00280CC4DF|nr:nucleotidyl transferase AbiEii/AbiGii toxin family protein [Pelagicoccus sp. SDUM812002]MDQ8188485.1 nucleotidyl transferase AbiEii/AbiGii toxin family protein [Pelagicoccus sp. SDUM812002]